MNNEAYKNDLLTNETDEFIISNFGNTKTSLYAFSSDKSNEETNQSENDNDISYSFSIAENIDPENLEYDYLIYIKKKCLNCGKIEKLNSDTETSKFVCTECRGAAISNNNTSNYFYLANMKIKYPILYVILYVVNTILSVFKSTDTLSEISAMIFLLNLMMSLVGLKIVLLIFRLYKKNFNVPELSISKVFIYFFIVTGIASNILTPFISISKYVIDLEKILSTSLSLNMLMVLIVMYNNILMVMFSYLGLRKLYTKIIKHKTHELSRTALDLLNKKKASILVLTVILILCVYYSFSKLLHSSLDLLFYHGERIEDGNSIGDGANQVLNPELLIYFKFVQNCLKFVNLYEVGFNFIYGLVVWNYYLFGVEIQLLEAFLCFNSTYYNFLN